MPKHKHLGKGCKTRHKRKKTKREKGMPNVNTMLQTFEPGEEVHIVYNSSLPGGAPYRRFIGRTGKIKEKRGSCYVVVFKDMGATKEMILHPAHLKKKGK